MVKLVTITDNEDNERSFINQGEEDEMEIIGYKKCKWLEIISWFCTALSFGILILIYKWVPRYHLMSTHTKCHISSAHKLLVIERYQKVIIYHVTDVNEINLINSRKDEKVKGTTTSDSKNRQNSARIYFNDGYVKDFSNFQIMEVKKYKYIWVNEKNKFLKLSGLGSGLKNSQFYSFDYLTNEEHLKMKTVFGENYINVPIQSYLDLFIEEATNPYYVYQALCYIFWFYAYYYEYAIAICIWTFGSIILSVVQIHKAQTKLNDTVHFCDTYFVNTVTNDGIKRTSSDDLVPGDMMIVECNAFSTLPCDAVLLSGSCIVNESMLTGESVPLIKTALPNSDEEFQERKFRMNILYCGTKIIQTRCEDSNPVLALVMKTGYSTAKGNLVRSILYPPPVDYVIENGVFTLIYIIAAIGTLATVVMCSILIYRENLSAEYIFVYTVSLLSTILPAALPGAMTLSKIYVVQRLEHSKIFCINSNTVNLAGSVDCVCVDKTGTLTEDGLDVWGVVPAENGLFLSSVKKPITLENNNLKFALASCHSISLINGIIEGDPMDKKMFESTGWTFNEPSTDGSDNDINNFPSVQCEDKQLKIFILHQNHFLSDLQRMSVVCKYDNMDHRGVVSYCKGSPETIMSLSISSSVPKDFKSKLEEFTSKGYRVIGLGRKIIEEIYQKDLNSLTREQCENSLEFLGLLVLENQIKPNTLNTLQMLKKANLKIVMITGDNINTAMSVSRDSQIVEPQEHLVQIESHDRNLSWTIKSNETNHIQEIDVNVDVESLNLNKSYKLALSGATWQDIQEKHSHLIPNILVRTAVFARMSSEQKYQIVVELQNLGYSVLMCGDGANDCGALKTANVGVSLSEEEASVAAPFTSIQPDITCIPKIIKEGRAALTSSFSLIKYLIISSTIEFVWSTINILIFDLPTSAQYIYIDIFINMHLSLYFGLTPPNEGILVHEKPITSILSLCPLLSIIVHSLILITFQLLATFIIPQFPWYSTSELEPGYQCFPLYSIAIFQYIILAITCSQDYPYIQPLYKNKPFLIGLIATITISIFVVLYPADWIVNILGFLPTSLNIINGLTSVVIVLINFILCILFEKLFIEKLLFQFLNRWKSNRKRNKMLFPSDEQENQGVSWLLNLGKYIRNDDVTDDNNMCYVNESFCK